MPYTRKDAEREVGASTDWLVGLEASIKKFEQRVKGDAGFYSRTERCGLCFVSSNRKLMCRNCLAQSFCDRGHFDGRSDKEILQALKKLRKELGPMDCSKVCANFKPKNESPFPEGLKTEDLRVGMVVTRGDRDSAYICTVLGPPDETWLKVLRAYPGSEPHKHRISLANHGCQPHKNGRWHQSSWLRKVK